MTAAPIVLVTIIRFVEGTIVKNSLLIKEMESMIKIKYQAKENYGILVTRTNKINQT